MQQSLPQHLADCLLSRHGLQVSVGWEQPGSILIDPIFATRSSGDRVLSGAVSRCTLPWQCSLMPDRNFLLLHVAVCLCVPGVRCLT